MATKKKRRTKKRHAKTKIGYYLGNIVLGLAIVIVVMLICVYMLCNIQSVAVEGSQYYVPEEIEAYVLTGKYNNNSVYVTLDNWLHPKKDIPFVESYKVQLTSYDSVKIIVNEKPMLGYFPISDGTYAYFDENGDVVEISNRVLDNQLPVSGVVLESAEVGKAVPMDEDLLSGLISTVKLFSENEIGIWAANFDEFGNLGVCYNQVYINLGDCSNLEDKVKRLPYILPHIADMSGTLHLEDWSTQDTDIVFEKSTQ